MLTNLIEASRELGATVGAMVFEPPVAYVYNPLDYAWSTWETYLRRWVASPREVLLLGMNPGPFGMAQTGVPFGDPTAVRDLLGIEGPVGRPAREHPKRRVEGFALRRQEVSGTRLWGWAADRPGGIATFFERFAVLNYCPLLFLGESGRNLTPETLAACDRLPLEAACDRFLAAALQHLEPRLVVGVGAYAEGVLRRVAPPTVRVGRILHPSPASPAANRGWAQVVRGQFQSLGVEA